MKAQFLVFFMILLLASSGLLAADNWPQFRGQGASGISETQALPDTWNVPENQNILWKTAVPGLSHASPIIWNQHIFLVSAVSSKGDNDFKHGLYGAGTASDDFSSQRWEVHAYSLQTGALLWRQVAYEGEPKSKRHIKATYANATPVTNGSVLVAMFGSEGVYAFDLEGNKLWQKDLGDLNIGAYNAPDYEWGHASSPVIHKDKVFLQCDTSEQDFLVALDLKTGKELWRTVRDELPSWGTPTIVDGSTPELVANGSNFIMGYDPQTGKELWRLGGSSQITAPTPIYTKDLILVSSGRRPVKPIFAIKRGSRGNLTLPQDQTSSKAIAWSTTGRGPYMPTPIIVDDLLYSINNNGVLDCYQVNTGKEVYRQRINHAGGGFSASPVSAGGKLFLPSEDGDIFVVKTGTAFELVASNPMDELLMATPAISQGKMVVRGHQHLFAIAKN